MVDLFTPIINPVANLRPVTATAPVDIALEQAKSGIDFTEKVEKQQQQKSLQVRLQEIGQKALKGNQQAIDELALMPGGAKLAQSLQTVANTRDEGVMRHAQQVITTQAKFAASLLPENENFVRMSLRREAIKKKEAGDIEGGNELMRISQLPQFAEVQSELRQDVALAAPAEKLLTNSLNTLADTKKIREETRGSVRKKVNTINTSLESIETNFSKIQNLAGEIEKGNRTAVAQALISVVKLGDPTSAVLEAEMKSALNQQNPIAAVTELLSSKGVGGDVASAVVAKIDPLNPDNVNVNELLATGRALVSSQLPTIRTSFNSAVEESKFLTEEGQQAIFTGELETRIGNIGKLLATNVEQPATAVGTETVVTEEVQVDGVPVSQFQVGETTVGEITSADQVDEALFRTLPKQVQKQIVSNIKAAEAGQ